MTKGTQLGDVAREFARNLGGVRAWLVRMGALAALLDELLPAGPIVRRRVLDEENHVADVVALGKAARHPAEVAKAEHARGSDPALRNDLLVVDVSSVSCKGCAAARLGAHLAVDDLSLVWGQSADHPRDLCAVALSRDAERTRPGIMERLGAAQASARLTADELRALSGALATLGDRMRARNDHAATIAAFLSCHPRVEQVSYPGLPSHPHHALATTVLNGGFGPWVVYRAADRTTRLCVGEDDPLEACAQLEALLTPAHR